MSLKGRIAFAFGCLGLIGLYLPQNLEEWRGVGRLRAFRSLPLEVDAASSAAPALLPSPSPVDWAARAALRGRSPDGEAVESIARADD